MTIVDQLWVDGTYIYINPPPNTEYKIEILEDTSERTVERHEWSHGVIAIVTNNHVTKVVSPVFNYGVVQLGNGDFEIDYSNKNLNFKDY